uniref:Uncharacterized protein n=1 Tax=Romanomermis culicivorax TaxID=13658 RepID=A0A915KJY3_ROMCU
MYFITEKLTFLIFTFQTWAPLLVMCVGYPNIRTDILKNGYPDLLAPYQIWHTKPILNRCKGYWTIEVENVKSVFSGAVGSNDSRVKSRPNRYKIRIQLQFVAESSEILERRSKSSREDFLRIPELAINPLGDRIVNAFYTEW